MEALTMLKHWRGGNGGASTVSNTVVSGGRPAATVANAVLGPSAETDDDGDDFIDLEFDLPDDGEYNESEETSDEEADDEERQLSCKSPSDDLFFKGRLLPLENNTRTRSSPSSLLKSATKFRVLMLRLKRNKSTQQDTNPSLSPKRQLQPQLQHCQQQQSKSVPKFKLEETPLVSLFALDNSSKKLSSSDEKLAEEKRNNNSKDVVQRYLNKIKPLYIRVSKRYAGKPRFSGPLNSSGRVGPTDQAAPPPPSATPSFSKDSFKSQNPVSLHSGLKVVCRRLGKSRSASASVAAVRSPPSLPRRRDDSLLQQQDGIQSAIAHCKRSFQAPKATPEYPSQLVRSNSDPGEGRAEKNETLDCVP